VSTESSVRGYEWDYFPEDDGESFKDRHGHFVVGWHPRHSGQHAAELRAAFEAYEGHALVLRPILTRFASEVECKINGWEDGTFVRCTTRAQHPQEMWQIEWAEEEEGE
jgi:hypothetical protein